MWWSAWSRHPLRRSELAALTLDQVAEHPNGLVLTLPRSKTNPTGEHVELVVLPRAANPARCPVVALNLWVRLAGITDGPVFRSVGKSNQPAGPGPGDLTLIGEDEPGFCRLRQVDGRAPPASIRSQERSAPVRHGHGYDTAVRHPDEGVVHKRPAVAPKRHSAGVLRPLLIEWHAKHRVQCPHVVVLPEECVAGRHPRVVVVLNEGHVGVRKRRVD